MRRRGLTRRERDRIDAALIDIYRAAWEAEIEYDPTLLRAAYMQGRVDQELGRIPLAPDGVPAKARTR